MVEKEASKFTTVQDLVRVINSTFDESVLTIEGSDIGLSFGTPLEMLKSKGKLGKLLTNIAGVPTFAVDTESSWWFEQENTQLRIENYALRERIRAVEERLANIEAALPKERVIILRDISKEEAKQEIRTLFSTGQTLYYSDIAEELRLDLEMVVDICNELQESGEISIDAGIS